jgi:hypothetical protein
LERESFERILAFATNSFLLIQWRNFEPAKEANLDFKAVLYRIHDFFEPLVVAIIENKDFPKQWNCAKRKWESPSLS